ncbi:tyrosine-type recombinase/integrase [Pseudomonas sp. Marseille-QA0332]
MIESEIDLGIFVSRVEAERTAFHQLIDRYISEIVPKHKGAYSEIKRLEALKRYPLATRIVATLTSSDFARYRDERLKIRKGNTVKRELALFQCMIEVARRKWGIHLAENPVRIVSRPSYNNERSRRLDPVEEQYILSALELCERRANGTYADASHNPRIRPIVQLAIETAMRRGEIFELRWKHVNLNRRTAHLPATKNGLPRTIPLSPNAIKLLRGLPAPCAVEYSQPPLMLSKKLLCGGWSARAQNTWPTAIRHVWRRRRTFWSTCVSTIYGMRLHAGSRPSCRT